MTTDSGKLYLATSKHRSGPQVSTMKMFDSLDHAVAYCLTINTIDYGTPCIYEFDGLGSPAKLVRSVEFQDALDPVNRGKCSVIIPKKYKK